ncbi:Rieske 2Fe-2S domain-containing protein [Streptomyces sp. NBC_01261]|uniref:Rieske 2Fe-2S domain-containing protein n=1 Tax=unclassified Streptomyces TaxID=2593676 RepID=UPI002E36DA61|nr:Rieske 2Fe-2S domain-containing protein [Streptomyces sp. NBC_01261]
MSTDTFAKLTQVGPGTPTGEFFRQFWMPIARSKEFEAEGAPIRLMALGERLVGFRDSDGRMGIFDHRCPHRCASLFFGRNEEGGLRCSYHGWKFDVEGRCTDVPSIAGGGVPTRARAKAYSVRERNGIVWIYMGSRETPPPLPEVGVVADEDELEIQMWLRECNWLQGMEGDIDAAHLAFLHHGGHEPEEVGEHFIMKWLTSGRAVETNVVNTVAGTMEGHRRPDSFAPDYRHYTQQLLPSWTVPGQSSFDAEEPVVRFWLPMDDTHSMIFQLSRPRALVDGKSIFLAPLEKLPGVVVRMADLLQPATDDWYGRGRLTPAEENDYFLDRDAQAKGNYSGVQGIQIQDKMITESMGPVVDRSFEHLSVSDLMISRTRRRLLKAVEVYEATGELPAHLDDPAITRGTMAGGGHVPEGTDWLQYYRDVAEAAGADPRILESDLAEAVGGKSAEGAGA